MCCVAEDEVEGEEDGDQAEDGAEEEAQVVEGEVFADEGFFDDCHVFEGGVACWHRGGGWDGVASGGAGGLVLCSAEGRRRGLSRFVDIVKSVLLFAGRF